jgi:Amt family ammonium transporter
MVFQMMFAVITPAIITGGFAERKRFKAFVLFSLLWSTLVYDPIAHWVWGVGGWLHNLGALDFAGGTVVHISSGTAALMTAFVVGRRVTAGSSSEPHDATMTILGVSLLWFGWFGFNAGSALSAGPLAVSAFVVTNVATAMAGLTWMTLSWVQHKQPSVLGTAAGAVAGLVAITPASGFVNPMGALLIGMGAGFVCFMAVQLKSVLKVDDTLDVFAVHGVGGIWGALATGLFATVAVNPAGGNGAFFGNPHQVLVQLVAVAATVAYSAGATFLILKVVERVVALRVGREEEIAGLDRSQHGEPAYQF